MGSRDAEERTSRAGRAARGRLKPAFLLSCRPLRRKGRKPLFCGLSLVLSVPSWIQFFWVVLLSQGESFKDAWNPERNQGSLE